MVKTRQGESHQEREKVLKRHWISLSSLYQSSSAERSLDWRTASPLAEFSLISWIYHYPSHNMMRERGRERAIGEAGGSESITNDYCNAFARPVMAFRGPKLSNEKKLKREQFIIIPYFWKFFRRVKKYDSSQNVNWFFYYSCEILFSSCQIWDRIPESWAK